MKCGFEVQSCFSMEYYSSKSALRPAPGLYISVMGDRSRMETLCPAVFKAMPCVRLPRLPPACCVEVNTLNWVSRFQKKGFSMHTW